MVLTVALSVRAADSVSCSLWCPTTLVRTVNYTGRYCTVWFYGRLWNVMSGRETCGEPPIKRQAYLGTNGEAK
jgi:hypothetical protein